MIFLLSFLLGMGVDIYARMIYPLIILRREVARIGQGDFAPLSPDLGDNELGELSRALNAMGQALMHRSDELEQAKSVEAHQEKMHALGLMTANIAHEVGNPLTAISALLDLARHKLTRSEYGLVAHSLNDAMHELRRTEEIITNILDFGRRSSDNEEVVHVDAVIRSAIQLVRLSSSASHIQIIQADLEDIPLAWGNVDMLRQVVVNLLLNGMDACKANGKITITLDRFESYIVVDVIDQGEGVPESIQEDIFSPLFSTKPKGEGTGLGLSISRDLMRKMHGNLELMASNASGCRFRLTVPVMSEGKHADIGR